MQENTSDANPEGVNQDSGEDLSPDALIGRALKKPEAKPEPEEKSEEDEAETEESSSETVDETETQEQEETEEEAESEEDDESGDDDNDVLSQIDFKALDEKGIKQFGEALTQHLTPEQAASVAQAMGTKGGQEYGKMRGQLRAKDDEIANLKSQLNEKLAEVIPSNNPHNKITSKEELDTRETELRNSYEYLDNLLTTSTDDYFDIQGQEVDRKTAAEWKKFYKSHLDAVPERRKALDELSNLSEFKDKEMAKTKEAVPFLQDEESEGYKAWKKEIESPDFSLLSSAFPKQGAKLASMIAKAIAFDQKPKAPKKFNIPLKSKAKAIGDAGSGARSGNPRAGRNKKRQELSSKIQSGDFGDRDVLDLISGAFGR